jgi:hypothetical protein
MLNLKRRYVLALALLAVFVFVGASVAVVNHLAEPTRYSSSISKANTRAASPNAALAAVLGRAQRAEIVSAKFGAAPADAITRGLPWLNVTLKVPAVADGLDVLPQWVADLVEGDTAEGIGGASNVRAIIGGATFSAALPDGSVVPDLGGGIGDVATGQAFSDQPNGQVRSDLTQKLASLGLTPIRIDVVHALTAAPAVIAQANDVPTALGQYNKIVTTLFGDPPVYEGYYLEIRDSTGQPVLRASAAFRTGAGRFWVSPAHASEVTGVDHLGTTPKS